MASNATSSPAVSLIEISRVLEETARLVRQHAGGLQVDSSAQPISASKVRAVIEVRWLRRRFLGFEASDATWSMMLELYAAQLEGRSLSQTRLGIAAGVPQTTAHQVIKRMAEAGLFERQGDADDRRLIRIELSPDAAKRIGAYLTATHEIAGLAA